MIPKKDELPPHVWLVPERLNDADILRDYGQTIATTQ